MSFADGSKVNPKWNFLSQVFYFLANAEQFHALIRQYKLNTLEMYKRYSII